MVFSWRLCPMIKQLICIRKGTTRNIPIIMTSFLLFARISVLSYVIIFHTSAPVLSFLPLPLSPFLLSLFLTSQFDDLYRNSSLSTLFLQSILFPSIASSGEISFIKVHTARFMVTPECAVFVKSSTVTRPIIPDRSADSGMIDGSAVIGDMADIRLEEKAAESAEENASNDDEWELIIGLRDTAHLTYLHCSTYAQRFVSLNEADWDTHCSFTPLHMVVSPDRKYLLISTDKNLMFMVKIGTSKRLRIFAGGHSCGDYGKPSASFDSTGKYVYCNNEEGCSVCVYSVGSEKPVKFLAAHSGSVRGVTCHPSRALLATASYDKSVILWTASAR